MKSIIRLTLANIKRGKGAFSGIILLMALITFTFSGTVSNDDQLRSALSSSLDEADVGELTVFIYDDLLTEDMLDSIGKNRKVKSFTQKSSMIVNQKPVVGGKEQDIAIQLKGFYDGIKVFNSDFDSFTADTDLESGGIYLPYKLEAMEEMKKGAEISFTTSSGSEETFIVRGFYEDPVHGATTIADNQCIISAEDFERLCSHELDHLDSDVKRLILQDELYIHGEEGVSAAELKRSLINKNGIINSSNWAVSRQHIMDLFEMYSNTGTRGMAAFTIMLLLVIHNHAQQHKRINRNGQHRPGHTQVPGLHRGQDKAGLRLPVHHCPYHRQHTRHSDLHTRLPYTHKNVDEGNGYPYGKRRILREVHNYVSCHNTHLSGIYRDCHKKGRQDLTCQCYLRRQDRGTLRQQAQY
ncbi:MAG TPA: hypothetical protein PKY34_00070 [Ruminococcus sp.]|nr:hypothetical protein [Ruminococcus sp.]